jgi:hypothetical protein
MKKSFLSLLFLAPAVYAAGPLFSMVPVGSLPVSVPPGGTATAQYTVTNNAPYALQDLGLNTLPTSQTPAGVTQNTVGVGVCSSPFNLQPGASCILSLTITADALADGKAVGGPEVCFTVDNPSRCSVPNANARLNITSGFLSLYVVNHGTSTVTRCFIEPSNGTFSSCADSGATGFTGITTTINFASSAGQLYAYLGQNLTNSPLTFHPPAQCLVGTNGQLSACTDIAGYIPVLNAGGIAFTTATDPLYAYVVPVQGGVPIYKCPLDASVPTFNGNCVDSGLVLVGGAADINFQTIAGTQYGYVTDQTTRLSQVGVAGNGDLSAPLSQNIIPQTQEVTFAEVGGNTYAYITQSTPPTVMFCSVDTSGGASNGQLNNCAVTSTGSFSDPIGIVWNTLSGVNYVYVGDFTNNTVTVCTLNASTGDFSSCAPAGGSFNQPYGLGLQ